MESGKLRHKLIIQSATEAQDGHGEPIETWAKVATVWGSVVPVSAREVIESGAVTQDVTHKITIRYYSGLTASHRFLYGSRIFNILQPPINVAERNRQMDVLCKEEV